VQNNTVVITGIGLISSLGEGTDQHWQGLERPSPPCVDSATFSPYTIHALPEGDWSRQIPRRGDLRQMGTWQRIGTYAAGLALRDAGIGADDPLCSSMDMIIAAGGGERDVAVDTQILAAARTRDDLGTMLNEHLVKELRPTLFLAQLSNLLAGNISIVHKVTGSSHTFMGEEGAGISAIATAVARLRAGQATHILVGGSYNAAHPAMLLSYELNGMLKSDGWSPLWERSGSAGGGIVTGSGGAFLVLETLEFAKRRSARIYAAIEAVCSSQVCRERDSLQQAIASLLGEATADGEIGVVVSGASGATAATADEKAALNHFTSAPVRGVAGRFGHWREAGFPLAVALAALSVSKVGAFPPLDAKNEKAGWPHIYTALATSIGAIRGEGVARLVRV
jgi:3-oxoacyl-[acyl-carrier-protein] synthase II